MSTRLAWLSGLYFFWPPKGREFQERTERVFGPKTRATIWESYNPERPVKVDVIRTAKEVGEYHLDD